MPLASRRSITGPKAPRRLRFRNVAKVEISAAVRRAAAGFDFLQNRVGGDIARRVVLAEIRAAVAVDELFEVAVEQLAAELVAKRVPHDRIHADQPRRQMTDGEKLHKFHVD